MISNRIHQSTSTALFVALFSVSSYITLPIVQIPFTAQSIFIMLSGLILGKNLAVASVMSWLLLGILGLPVFAQGGGGLAILLSPRGGYLIGYILMAYTAGIWPTDLLQQRMSPTIRTTLRTFLLLPSMLSVYIIALPWLRWQIEGGFSFDEVNTLWHSWQKTLFIGFFPFIFTDLVKTIIVAFTYETVLRHKYSHFLSEYN
ncbi:biotin transporter BioY [Entomospira nematocerorum]|uniref:Biotin transporter n=1 Tax=Entomospira nematocerorum TaxID=2719987 RepID=A0A968GD85_9SPIO|nr:biotin transporter BioY [Entomospira nematocera]NIZ46932.1 biotin transporter BioY [Entomospira nematocera]WDI33271.1 biotin transporter BioY [Entomospira nematocera]